MRKGLWEENKMSRAREVLNKSREVDGSEQRQIEVRTDDLVVAFYKLIDALDEIISEFGRHLKSAESKHPKTKSAVNKVSKGLNDASRATDDVLAVLEEAAKKEREK